MRYHYEPKNSIQVFGKTITNGDIFRSATLFEIRGRGILVVQKVFDEKEKCFYFSSLPPGLANDIYLNENFRSYFMANAKENPPVVSVRKIMWALRMKPLEKPWWEKDILDLR